MPLDSEVLFAGVVSGQETSYRMVTIDLSIARPAPGSEILLSGSSIVGSSASVWQLDGKAELKFNANTSDPIPLYGREVIGIDYTSLWIVNSSQPGKTLLLYVGAR